MKWVFFLYLSLGCQTLQPQKIQIPIATIWDGKIYVGDSVRLGVARNKVDPVVACSDPAFNRMICMTLEDYTALMQYFIQAACVSQ